MKSENIGKLVRIFNEKYPLPINDLQVFRRQAQYIKADVDVETFNTIIENYIKYADTNNLKYRTPVEFIYEKLYYKDFTKKYIPQRRISNEDDGLTDGQRYYKKHKWWFDNEAPRFAKIYPSWKYEMYIPEAKECFHFYPASNRK